MDDKTTQKFELDQLVYCLGDGDSLYRISRLTETGAYLITTEENGVDGGWESLRKLRTEEEYENFYKETN